VTPSGGRTLFNPATRDGLAGRYARRLGLMVAVVAVVSGGLIGGLHYEELPFLADWLGYCDGAGFPAECEYPGRLDWLAGVAGGVVMGFVLVPLVPLARRRFRPSVFCRGCDGAGWIEDLVPTGGRCPRCGSDRFDFDSTELDPVFAFGSAFFLPRRNRERDVRGAELVVRGSRE